MSGLKQILAGALTAGVILSSGMAHAFIIPVASVYEIGLPDLQLMIESELTRWKEEALKYQEMAYTDLLGRVGGGGLDDGGIMAQMQQAAQDNINLLNQTKMQLNQVTNLSAYTEATKKQIEDNFVIQTAQGLNYTTEKINKIQENQREAVNDWAATGLSMAAGVLEATNQASDESNPQERAAQLSKAQDLNAMRELMLRMDRRIYANSLQLIGMEATDSGIRALQVLQGLSSTATASGQAQEQQGAEP